MVQNGKLSPAFIAMILNKNPKDQPAELASSNSDVEPSDVLPGAASPSLQSYQSPSIVQMLSDAPLSQSRMLANPMGVGRPEGDDLIQMPDFGFGYGGGYVQNGTASPQISAGNAPLNLSSNGLAELKKHEGHKLKTYKDRAGYDTIGYGHKLTAGESYPNGIDDPRADQLLSADTSTAQDAVRNNVTVPLTQNQFDALTSFTYNAGANPLRNSTLLTKLNQGDYTGASSELPKWNKITRQGKKVVSQGLSNRRAAEKTLFDTP